MKNEWKTKQAYFFFIKETNLCILMYVFIQFSYLLE